MYLPVGEGGAGQEGVAVPDQNVADGGRGLLACYLSFLVTAQLSSEYHLLRVAEVLQGAVSDLGVCADAAPGARGHRGRQQTHCDQYLHSAQRRWRMRMFLFSRARGA